MLALSLSLLSFVAGEPLAPAPASAATTNPKAYKALKAWIQGYRRGKWRVGFLGNRLTADDPAKLDDDPLPSVRARFLTEEQVMGLVREMKQPRPFVTPAGRREMRLPYLHELRAICAAIARDKNAEATQALLPLAAVGLDADMRYTPAMVPSMVRRIGEEFLSKMEDLTVLEALLEAAAGAVKGSRSAKSAQRAAAMRLMGRAKFSKGRKVMLELLEDDNATLRAGAAEGLGRLGEDFAIEALGKRLRNEGQGKVIVAIIEATRHLHGGQEAKGKQLARLRDVVDAAGLCLLRADTWHTDLVIVDFLAKYRFKPSIPRLIELLARFVEQPGELKSGRLSGRLRVRTHETLKTLTGAIHGPDNIAAWRSFWQQNEKTFELPEDPAKQDGKAPATVAGTFFNIPVQGTRVVFVIDISGSMALPLGRKAATASPGGSANTTKYDIAREELLKAVKSLPADTRFNVIFYDHEVDSWKKGLVPASDSNKRALDKFLSKRKPRGATNIFDALNDALGIKSLVEGEHYDSRVDEIFFLSDGLPNRGAIIDPATICRVIRNTNKASRVKINTVFLRTPAGAIRLPPGAQNPNEVGEKLMRQLAKENGGKCVVP